MGNHVIEEIKEQEVIKEEVKAEPTIEEQIQAKKDYIAELTDYIRFIRLMPNRDIGEVFTFKSFYCELIKKTKSGHVDIMMYELLGTEDEPERGKFVSKKRHTPDEFKMSIKHANNVIFRLEAEIRKLNDKLIPIVH